MALIIKKLNPKGRLFWVVVIILLTIPASYPLIRSGFFHFSDEPHIANLYQMFRAFSSGQLPPRWAPDMVYGYGYPLFNFYYPLPYYLGSLFFALTNSLIISLKFTFLITIPVSAIGMFFWLNKHTDKLAALAGSLIYVYTPYRAVDLYVRGALGENFAFMLAPWVGLILFEVAKSRKVSKVGLMGLLVGLFILAHNLAPLLFLPWFFVYSIILIDGPRRFKKFVRLITGFFIGVAISAYWWLPAFIEKNLLRTQTPFYYKDHFPFIKQIIFSPFRYGASNPGIGDDISFQLGIINWVLLGLTAVLAVKLKRKIKSIYLVFIGGLLVSFFMMNIRSSFIWDIFSLSTYVQFPWRFLMLTTFLSSSLVIFINISKIIRIPILIILSLFSFIFTINYFQPSEYYYPNDNYFLRRFFINRGAEGETQELSEEYKNYSEDYLLLPNWTDRRPDKLPPSLITSEVVEIDDIEKISEVEYKASLSNESPDKEFVNVNLLYFPGWEVFDNGSVKEIEIVKPYGSFGFFADTGLHSIEISWNETPLRKSADIISLVAIVISLGLIYTGKRKIRL